MVFGGISLANVIIEGSLISIGNEAFNECTSLFNFTYLGTKNPLIHKNTFNKCASLKTVHVLRSYVSDSFGDFSVKLIDPH